MQNYFQADQFSQTDAHPFIGGSLGFGHPCDKPSTGWTVYNCLCIDKSLIPCADPSEAIAYLCNVDHHL